MIDYVRLKALAGQLSVPVATTAFPDTGERAIKALLTACRQMFAQLDPSQLQGPVVMYCQADTDTELTLPAGERVNNLVRLTHYLGSGFFLQVEPSSGIMHVSPGQAALDVDELRKFGIVFIHDDGDERFLISDQEVTLDRLFPGKQSFFSTPYYADLDDALEYYRSSLVKQSTCEILKETWFDDKRLYLKAKPEDAIQRSLRRFLRYTLRSNAEVMREQNVNDTKPVDIRVTFQFANRVALIEVKWLGKSRKESGDPATEYSQSRAVEGAHQLGGYLDSFALSSPESVAVGYLIVLDARRRGLTPGMETINEADGMFYATRSIQFPAEFARRPDFADPVRMFAEPVVG